MIKIPDYDGIDFIKWFAMNSHGNDLDEVVETYLYENSKKWDLKFFLQLYQDFLCHQFKIHVVNKDYVMLLKAFCQSSHSMSYLQIEVLDKTPQLQPLFDNFILYLKSKNVYDNINKELKQLAKSAYENERGIVEWFDNLIKTNVEELIDSFEIYINNSLNMSYKYEFEEWAKTNTYKNIEDKLTIDSFYKSKRKQYLLDIARIGFSSTDFKICLNYMVFLKTLPFMAIKPRKLSDISYEECIDFIGYLDTRGIRIEKSIPLEMLDRFLDDYSLENKKINRKRLKKSVEDLVGNKIKLREIIIKWKKEGYNLFDINRYYECKNHCILLFEKNGKLSEFLKVYLTDLHMFTKDTLDIYFTNADLKYNVSAYDVVERLCYLKVEKNQIPCMLVWNHSPNTVHNVSFEDLSHKEIFKVIKSFVTALENSSFDESVTHVREVVDNIKEGKSSVNYNFENCKIDAVGTKAVAVTAIIKQ